MYVEGVCAGNNNNNNHYWSVTFTISYTENQLNRYCSYILDDMYEHVYASLSSWLVLVCMGPNQRHGTGWFYTSAGSIIDIYIKSLNRIV